MGDKGGQKEPEAILDEKEIEQAAEAVATAGKSGLLTVGKAQNKWAKKHKKAQRFAHQHNHDPEWFKHEKHVLICSWSGRPIFTRYGDESKLSAYLAVISAIISNFQKSQDNLRSIVAGDHKFVFVMKGPIYLIAISRTTESVEQLRAQLSITHDQIISVLTGQVHQILESQPQYDVRNLMGGTETLLGDLISEADRNPCFLLDSLHCLRMRKSARSRISAILKKSRPAHLLWSILFTGTRVIHISQATKERLHPLDLLILMNFVSNSQSLSSSESWTPICLPKFNKAYVHAYVCYLDEDVCLVMITSDVHGFQTLRENKQLIADGFEKKKCLEGIKEAMANSELDIDEIDAIPDLRHFIYKHDGMSQIVMSSPAPPYASKKTNKEILRRYQHLHTRTHDPTNPKPHSWYYEVNNWVTVLAWVRPGDFELYAAFTPLVTKEAAVLACNRILRWIKKEEHTLFIFP